MSAQRRLLNKKLSQIFRQRGLTVRPDAMQPLYDILQGDDRWEQTLKSLLQEIQRRDPKSGSVDAELVHDAIAKLRARTVSKPTLPLEVVDAFEMQPMRFDTQRRSLIAETSPPSLHAPACAKSAMHALRLAMLEGRTRRHNMFKAPVLSQSVTPREFIEITGIDALLGRTGLRVVLGMLVELDDGSFHIEDGHGSVPLDLSNAALTSGLFTRHSIVLAEGEMHSSGIFKVRQLGLPPPEPRVRSLEALGNLDYLRVKNASSPTTIINAPEKSLSSTDTDDVARKNAMLVVLSDVWLDKPAVLQQVLEANAAYPNSIPLPCRVSSVELGYFVHSHEA